MYWVAVVPVPVYWNPRSRQLYIMQDNIRHIQVMKKVMDINLRFGYQYGSLTQAMIHQDHTGACAGQAAPPGRGVAEGPTCACDFPLGPIANLNHDSQINQE
jgi:hypothetical protein